MRRFRVTPVSAAPRGADKIARPVGSGAQPGLSRMHYHFFGLYPPSYVVYRYTCVWDVVQYHTRIPRRFEAQRLHGAIQLAVCPDAGPRIMAWPRGFPQQASILER